MIKFIHKKHIRQDSHIKGLVIYYSLSDIVLGFFLVVLVSFFIFNYLEFSFKQIYQTSRPPTETHSANHPGHSAPNQAR
jgi:hypothetical protein